MSKVIYILADGSERPIALTDGVSLMEGSRDNDLPGITADCGGVMACATCHVYIDPDWICRITPPTPDEEAMLEYASHVQPNSRLSCQIPMSGELDGIIVRIPENQQ